MKKYTWLLFDADGTLFDYDAAETAALSKTLIDNGIEYSNHHLTRYKSINSALWKMFEEGTTSPDSLKVTRFTLLSQQFSFNVDGEKLSKDYLYNLSQCTHLFKDTFDSLKKLHKKFKIAIITNGLKEVQRPRFAKSEIGRFMDEIIISDEIGMVKPNPDIFDYAFEKMGMPSKEEVIIIGDSLPSDIKGGISYGIDTCWFNPGNYITKQKISITYIVQNLTELTKILIPD